MSAWLDLLVVSSPFIIVAFAEVPVRNAWARRGTGR
jgi:hypothetical protein